MISRRAPWSPERAPESSRGLPKEFQKAAPPCLGIATTTSWRAPHLTALTKEDVIKAMADMKDINDRNDNE